LLSWGIDRRPALSTWPCSTAVTSRRLLGREQAIDQGVPLGPLWLFPKGCMYPGYSIERIRSPAVSREINAMIMQEPFTLGRHGEWTIVAIIMKCMDWAEF
jgi:hypothetical protein